MLRNTLKDPEKMLRSKETLIERDEEYRSQFNSCFHCTMASVYLSNMTGSVL